MTRGIFYCLRNFLFNGIAVVTDTAVQQHMKAHCLKDVDSGRAGSTYLL